MKTEKALDESKPAWTAVASRVSGARHRLLPETAVTKPPKPPDSQRGSSPIKSLMPRLKRTKPKEGPEMKLLKQQPFSLSIPSSSNHRLSPLRDLRGDFPPATSRRLPLLFCLIQPKSRSKMPIFQVEPTQTQRKKISSRDLILKSHRPKLTQYGLRNTPPHRRTTADTGEHRMPPSFVIGI